MAVVSTWYIFLFSSTCFHPLSYDQTIISSVVNNICTIIHTKFEQLNTKLNTLKYKQGSQHKENRMIDLMPYFI